MPSNTTSNTFFCIYVLESLKDGSRYIDYTKNLKRKLKEHNDGKSLSTEFRCPFKLIYFEGCPGEEGAKRREYYLKTIQGRRFLGLRLINYKHKRPALSIES